MSQLASARKTGLAGLKPPLHEFCLPTAPMLPVPVVRCVIALERKYKGLEQEGLYRICGNKAKVGILLIIVIVNIHFLVKTSV